MAVGSQHCLQGEEVEAARGGDGTVNEAVCGGPLDSRWTVERFVLQIFDDPELQEAASQYWSEELVWKVMETGSELMSL
ncbi:hypothetical protein ATANTOWER_013048 [Ataeniobius toweri]|uniref:Uncharacterized protein n=1 Tax=Ataeniobius toweri TaxID=208326 RepID=A0ABU7BH15_9TELE|nr:hypothetical protein [Ataeniobius toweri]